MTLPHLRCGIISCFLIRQTLNQGSSVTYTGRSPPSPSLFFRCGSYSACGMLAPQLLFSALSQALLLKVPCLPEAKEVVLKRGYLLPQTNSRPSSELTEKSRMHIFPKLWEVSNRLGRTNDFCVQAPFSPSLPIMHQGEFRHQLPLSLRPGAVGTGNHH